MPTTAQPLQSVEDIETQVAELVQKMIGQPISREQPIMEAGLDSLGAVELRSSLQAKFAADLPATLTFDYPTVASLAKFLATQLSAVSSQAGAFKKVAGPFYDCFDKTVSGLCG